MRIWLSQHARTLAVTLAKLIRSPAASLLNVGVIGIALALPVGFHVGLANLQSFAGKLAVTPQLSLFLTPEAGATDVAQIEQRLKRHAGVRRYSYVSREQALREIRASTGLAEVVENLDQNPLPDAFVVDASDGSPQSLHTLRDEFTRWPKVAHVQLDSAWAQRLEAVLRLGRLAVLMLGALLAFALIAVTFNTIRLQILTQREEIEIAKLIGATNPFIRRPFLYFGALLGFAGGAAAWAIVLTGVYLFNDGLSDLSRLYGLSLQLRPLTAQDGLSLLLFAAWLGWFGAWLSVGRHLSAMERR